MGQRQGQYVGMRCEGISACSVPAQSVGPSGANMRQLAHDREVSSLICFDKWLFTGSADTTVKQWEIDSGICVAHYVGSSLAVTSLAVIGEYLITGGYDGLALQWIIHEHGLSPQREPVQGALVQTYKGHKRAITSVHTCAGKLYTGSADRTIREWNMESGECSTVMNGHMDAVTSIASTAGSIISGSSDATAKKWTLDGENVITYTGHAESVNTVTVGGGKVYTGSSDRTVREWDEMSGECLRVLLGHTADVRALFLSQDQRTLFSGGGDDTARTWDLANGQCSRIYRGHSFRVSSVVAHQGAMFTGSWDYCVRRWGIDGDCEQSYSEGRHRWERCRSWASDGSPPRSSLGMRSY